MDENGAARSILSCAIPGDKSLSHHRTCAISSDVSNSCHRTRRFCQKIIIFLTGPIAPHFALARSFWRKRDESRLKRALQWPALWGTHLTAYLTFMFSLEKIFLNFSIRCASCIMRKPPMCCWYYSPHKKCVLQKAICRSRPQWLQYLSKNMYGWEVWVTLEKVWSCCKYQHTCM